MIKLYVEGNYFFFVNAQGVVYDDFARNVHFVPTAPSLDAYEMESRKLGKMVFNVTNATDKAGTPYDVNSFETFYKNNTGFSSASGGSGARDNEIVVTQANKDTTLGGVIDSTKKYFIDEHVDMGTTQITVPSTGISFNGHDFKLSRLFSTEDNYTMFISDIGGSGDVLGFDCDIETSGVNSQVYDLTDATGFHAFEFTRINYTNCTSLGELNGYRQGLELGSGRFGGSPTLTLSGAWLGGFRLTTTIVRSLSANMTTPLFKAGPGFVMNSRFLTDINCDMPTNASFCDFAPANFNGANLLQINKAIFTIDGVSNAEVNTDLLFPNIDHTDLASYWKGNTGLENTFVGGTSLVVVEATTPVTVQGDYYQLLGTYLSTGLEHFDSPGSGQLRHLGDSPREFEITGSLVLDSGANNEVAVRFTKWDDSASAFIDLDYTRQVRRVDNLLGGRDVAYYAISLGVTLDKNDYLVLKAANLTGTADFVLESDSFFRVQER